MSAAIDEGKLEALATKVMSDVAGAMGLLMAYLGDQSGLYASLEAHGPIRSDALADREGLEPKYVREWLSSNAAHGYVTYDEIEETFSLSPEQALIFAREGDPACMQGFFMSVLSQMETHAQAVETFRSGQGRAWSDHSQCCFCGTDRFFRPGYEANLLASWIPALDGVEASLQTGARVADVGCGRGSSTVLMAKAFPSSRFYGFDFHEPSVEEARARARDAGVENVEFHVATAKSYAEGDFDLVCIFDALHDMGDPVGAAVHIRSSLAPNGTFMLVEPQAGDRLAENFHPLGAIYYSFSTTVCTPCSLSQEVGLGLGTQAGEKRLTQVLNEAGFGHVRRAAETDSNMVLEVRP